MIEMIEWSLIERIRLAEARATFVWLIEADGLVSEAFTRGAELTDDERQASRELAQILKDTTQNAVGLARSTCVILESRSGPDASLGEGREVLGSAVTEDDWAVVQEVVDNAGSVTALACTGADAVEANAERAIADLQGQIEELAAGRNSSGDLAARFMSGLAMVSMAAGLVTIWIPPHAHAGAAIAGGAAVYRALKCSELDHLQGEAAPL